MSPQKAAADFAARAVMPTTSGTLAGSGVRAESAAPIASGVVRDEAGAAAALLSSAALAAGFSPAP